MKNCYADGVFSTSSRCNRNQEMFAGYNSFHEDSDDYDVCFRIALFHSLSCLCFLYRLLTISVSTVFGPPSLYIDKVFSGSLSLNVLLSEDSNVCCGNWLDWLGLSREYD